MDTMLYNGRTPGPREKRKRDARSERRVHFRSVDVVYFDLALGDNPAVRRGVPIALGPTAVLRVVLDVDEHQPLDKRPRYPRWIHPEKRRQWLAAEGVTREEIEAARRKVKAAQLDRIRSLPPLQKLEQLPWFVARGVRRKLRRMGSFSSMASWGSSTNLAELEEPPKPKGLGSSAAQAEVATAPDVGGDDSEARALSRRLSLMAGGRDVDGGMYAKGGDAGLDTSLSGLSVMDGSLAGVRVAPPRSPKGPSIAPDPVPDDSMDGSLYGLTVFGGSLDGLRQCSAESPTSGGGLRRTASSGGLLRGFSQSPTRR
mmetsp:Transcript_27980/g.83862  ORF Transcript_27980/g.83862 Transcript_27980/m.83862 type:complete len:314 (-) Transcript_27980:41-982(-)